jgi:hypothetical protein
VVSIELCNRRLGSFTGLGIGRGADAWTGEGRVSGSECIWYLLFEELVLNVHDSSFSYLTPPVVKPWTNDLRQGMVADIRE